MWVWEVLQVMEQMEEMVVLVAMVEQVVMEVLQVMEELFLLLDQVVIKGVQEAQAVMLEMVVLELHS